MSEPTITLKQLRRDIAHELLMPFARRYSAGYSEIDTSSTKSKIIDASLTQKNNFWSGSWFYNVSTQEVSKIRAFDNVGKFFQLEVPLAATPTAGDDYEIHSIWNAIDIHKAINRAIQSVQRVYIDTVVDETLVFQEDVLEYSLSSLATTPWIVARVRLEYSGNTIRGTVQSATGTTMVVENSNILTDVDSDWLVSIYDGTGKGQLRSVSSVASATITVAAWDTNPDSTSKYALWNPTEQIVPWRDIEGWMPDSKEWPTEILFNYRMPSFYGMRIRLEYIAYPGTLSAETDTTIVPSEYLIPKACSLLFGQRLKDTKVDRETYYAESERYREMADQYLVRNMPNKPDIKLKSPHQSEFWREDDPLGWRW